MTTSNSTDFSSTSQQLIADAFANINAYNANEEIPPEDVSLAKRKLNRMIKSWQQLSYHLWVRQRVFLFPQKGKHKYTITSSDTHITTAYLKDEIAVDAVTGASTIITVEALSASVGDYIGIVLDSGYFYWDQINTIVTTTITLKNGNLPSDASIGNKLYTYTEGITQPFDILKMNRLNNVETETPMNKLGDFIYFEQPTKTTESSTPVEWNYDKQRDQAIINLWPQPNTVENLFVLLVSRKIQDVDILTNNFDFPQEWEEAIELNLSVRLAKAFSKNNTQGYIDLKQDAQKALKDALNFDAEDTVIQFEPNLDGSY